MDLAERLGQSLAWVEENISSQEMDLWQARALLKAEGCPHCGVNPLEFMEWSLRNIKCPTCKNDYGKVVPYSPSEATGLRTVKAD